MKAHKVIEALQGMQQIGLIDKSGDVIQEKIALSQKFEFDFGEFPNLSPEEMETQIRDLHLPYPLCFFEIPGVGSVLARDYKDAILIQPFFKISGSIATVPPRFTMTVEKSTSRLMCFSNDESLIKDWDSSDNNLEPIVAGLVSLVVRGLSVLNCSNVMCFDNYPPESLNKKRAKSGKCPLFTYKTLHIKTAKTQTSKSENSNIERSAPRLHMRRGHIRSLPSGVTTWIQSCMVGSSKNGVVSKDYRIT